MSTFSRAFKTGANPQTPVVNMDTKRTVVNFMLASKGISLKLLEVCAQYLCAFIASKIFAIHRFALNAKFF